MYFAACVCEGGYTGEHCEFDPCQSGACFHYGDISVSCKIKTNNTSGDDFDCGSCPYGWEGDGKKCNSMCVLVNYLDFELQI